ncbi:MAG: DUF4178 domain-containing protein [Pseudomonadota bacterium]
MTERPCPNCGAALPKMLRHARMVNCDFCGSSVVVADDVVAVAGKAGEMLDAPELIALGRPVGLPGGMFEAFGHVRYDYGRGHWDEYHGAFDGELVWVSVDEGDVVLQRPVEPDAVPEGGRRLFRIGQEITVHGLAYACTEVDSAEAVAFRGQLPEPVAIGDTHLFANFAGEGGAIVSGEIWDEGASWYHGAWIDPFQVTPL